MRLLTAIAMSLALAAGSALLDRSVAQEPAKIKDVLKQALTGVDAKQVDVREYDVPPGWATGKHHHSGHMFLYVIQGSGALETDGEVRSASPGQVVQQQAGRSMIMRNTSSTDRLKFVLFQVGAEGAPLVVPEK